MTGGDGVDISQIRNGVNAKKETYMKWLLDLLSIPSISITNENMRDCAEFVASLMRQAGLSPRLLDEYDPPMVYASYDEGAERTLLVYGHYDVQPPDPLGKWRSDPFKPLVRDDVIYARGVADNKGQFLAHIAAIELLLRERGKVGCNLRFLIEGGEEIGSPDLRRVFADHRDLFDVDAAFTSDALQHVNGQPFILPGLKGGMTVRLFAKGATIECHGAMADIVPNPLWRLIHALGTLKNEEGDILIEGFYDDAIPLSETDIELLAKAPNPIDGLRLELGLESLLPEAEKNFHVARTRPTCNITMIGDGNLSGRPRSNLPTEAHATLRLNIVPGQEPDDILGKLRRHLDEQGFEDIRAELLSATPASMTDVRHPYVRYTADVARDAFAREPLVYPRVIGSGPDHYFTKTLGVPSVWVPYAGGDSDTHAPNEHMTVPAFLEGICNSALFFARASGPEGRNGW